MIYPLYDISRSHFVSSVPKKEPPNTHHYHMPKKRTKKASKDGQGWILHTADTELLYPPNSTLLREVINSIGSIRLLKPKWHCDAKPKKKGKKKTKQAMKAMKAKQAKKKT